MTREPLCRAEPRRRNRPFSSALKRPVGCTLLLASLVCAYHVIAAQGSGEKCSGKRGTKCEDLEVLHVEGFFLPSQPDVEPPEITLEQPSIPQGVEGCSTSKQVVTLLGRAHDEQKVTRIIWENDRGGRGDAQSYIPSNYVLPDGWPDFFFWQAPDILLQAGGNRITLHAYDDGGHVRVETILLVHNPRIDFISFPDAHPRFVVVAKPSEVIVRIAIWDSPGFVPDSVRVLRVDSNNEILKVLGPMFDDGRRAHGDDIPLDAVFSAKVRLDEPIAGEVRLRVAAETSGGLGATTSFSEPFVVRVYSQANEGENSDPDSDEKPDLSIHQRPPHIRYKIPGGGCEAPGGPR